MTTRRRFFSSCAAVLVAPFLPTQARLKPVRFILNGAEVARLMVAGLPKLAINGQAITLHTRDLWSGALSEAEWGAFAGPAVDAAITAQQRIVPPR